MKKLIVVLILFILAVSFMLGLTLIYAENSETVEVTSSTQCNQVCRETANQQLKECREQRRNGLQECRLSTDPNCAEQVRQQAGQCIQTAKENKANCEFQCTEATCCLPHFGTGAYGTENCFTTTIGNCRSQESAVMECLGREKRERDVAVGDLRNFQQANLTGNGILANLSRTVNASGVHLGTYNASHDCDDFADELETFLTGLGYNATFTAYWCYGGPGNPPPTAHAVTDVHLAGGKIVFIEPQTGQFVNLDFDGDGVVEVNNNAYTPGANMGQTDDNCKISVFDNKAAAVAAGAPVD